MMIFPTLLTIVALTAAPQVLTVSDPEIASSVREALIRHGDASHIALDPMGALALFERVLSEDSASYGALWRAAREAVNLGMLAETDQERGRWALRAVEYARRARAVAPGSVEGLQWLAISMGRSSLEQGVKTRALMAVEIREIAEEALAVDPGAAGAHHVLGEWHAEIRRLSAIERWAARKLLGAEELGDASWESAVWHLERAVELAPEGLVHRLDLARTYLDQGRKEEARQELRAVIDLPVIEPTDPLHKLEARRLLDRL